MADEHFAPVILRFSTIYGLSGRSRFDLVVNLLTAKAVVDNEITIFGGDQWRPFLHVYDAALAILLVLKTPLNAGPQPDLQRRLERAELPDQADRRDSSNNRSPSAEIVNKDDITDQRNYWVNFNKINRTLEFVPEWTVETGIEQVIEALAQRQDPGLPGRPVQQHQVPQGTRPLPAHQQPESLAAGMINEETLDLLMQDVA